VAYNDTYSSSLLFFTELAKVLVCSMFWPLSGMEAMVDFALVQTVYYRDNMKCIYESRRFVSKQSQVYSYFNPKAGAIGL